MRNKKIFDGGNDQGNNTKGKRPILKNNDDAVAVWLKTDKNGNTYLSVSGPFDLHTNLFANDSKGSDTIQSALNQLAEYLEQQE